MSNRLDWLHGCDLPVLDQEDHPELWTKRYLSQMKEMFHDQKAVEEILKTEDPVIYEFQELKIPEQEGDIAFGISRVFPGKIGSEYYMTKGHFHTIIETAEVYLGLEGQGILLTENKDGDCRPLELSPMKAAYCAKGYAHRSINTGTTPLTTFYTFRADAGHNYGTIETLGFRNIVTEQNGAPKIITNDHWAK